VREIRVHDHFFLCVFNCFAPFVENFPFPVNLKKKKKGKALEIK
jgi:hypothetical protein